MNHWKTILVNGVAAVIGTLDATSLSQVVPPQYMGIALATLGLANMLLRVNLAPPVGSKAP